MHFEVRGSDGRSLRIDAVDWMMAMAHAIRTWRLDVSGWASRPHPDGGMLVTEPSTGRSWRVVESFVSGEGAQPPGGAPRSPYWTDEPAPPPDPSTTPADHTTFHDEGGTPLGPPGDLAERLFDISADIAGAMTVDAACERALDLVMSLVPCDGGSVLRGALDDEAFVFVAARGPKADRVKGLKVPYGVGLAGVAYDVGITVQVDDVSVDHRHFHGIDAETGYRTRAVLATPVEHDDHFFGVMELVNPTAGFEPWHTEVLEAVAGALAAYLDART